MLYDFCKKLSEKDFEILKSSLEKNTLLNEALKKYDTFEKLQTYINEHIKNYLENKDKQKQDNQSKEESDFLDIEIKLFLQRYQVFLRDDLKTKLYQHISDKEQNEQQEQARVNKSINLVDFHVSGSQSKQQPHTNQSIYDILKEIQKATPVLSGTLFVDTQLRGKVINRVTRESKSVVAQTPIKLSQAEIMDVTATQTLASSESKKKRPARPKRPAPKRPTTTVSVTIPGKSQQELYLCYSNPTSPMNLIVSTFNKQVMNDEQKEKFNSESGVKQYSDSGQEFTISSTKGATFTPSNDKFKNAITMLNMIASQLVHAKEITLSGPPYLQAIGKYFCKNLSTDITCNIDETLDYMQVIRGEFSTEDQNKLKSFLIVFKQQLATTSQPFKDITVKALPPSPMELPPPIPYSP